MSRIPLPLESSWLIARPIAHRGLHDASAARIENSVSAAEAAVAAGFGIECDVQRSADGEAVVFHDFTLDRLTGVHGLVSRRKADELNALRLGNTDDHIVALPTFLAAIDGRTPVICELKSAFDGDLRLAERVAAIACAYPGPLALKSFDPEMLLYLRSIPGIVAKAVPLGIVAEARFGDPEWDHLEPARRQELAALSHLDETRPDFLSYHVTDLPHAAATFFRSWARPVMAWTVRTPEQRQRSARWADQMVFEDFHP